MPELEVVQRPVPEAFVAVQPAGSVGAVTPSKFSLNVVLSVPTTLTEAEAEPEPPVVLVKDAELPSVDPHVPAVVLLTTCACVLVPAARVVGV